VNTSTVETGKDALDPGERLALLRRRKWLVRGVVALCSTAVWATAVLSKPAPYRVTMVAVPARTEGGLGALGGRVGRIGGLAALTGVSIGGGDRAAAEAPAVLGSQESTQRLSVESTELPKLSPSKWDAAAAKWTVAQGKAPTPARATKRFSSQTRTIVRDDPKTGLLAVGIDRRDRQEALEWSRNLVEALNEETARCAMRDADTFIICLDSELATTMVDTRVGVSRLLEAHIKQCMSATVTLEFLKGRECYQLQGLTRRLKQDLGTLTLRSAQPVGRFIIDIGRVIAEQPGSPSDRVVRAKGGVRAGGGSQWFGSNRATWPGEKIVVPPDAERTRPPPLRTAISTIIYNVAISVATVSTL